jgi:hypothetical protein
MWIIALEQNLGALAQFPAAMASAVAAHGLNVLGQSLRDLLPPPRCG